MYSYESIGNKSVVEAYPAGDPSRGRDSESVRMIAPNGLTVKIDQPVYIDFQLDHTMFFDGESKEFIGRYNEAAIRALSDMAGSMAGREGA